MSEVNSIQTELTELNKIKIEKAIKLLEYISEWSLYRDHPIGVSAKQALDILKSINLPTDKNI